MSRQAEENNQAPSVWSIAALIAANSSLLVAGLVYMGWAYLNALWGYFHLNPLSLGVGVPEYLLRSLALFSPVVILAVVVFVATTSMCAWNLDLPPRLHKLGDSRRLVTSAGVLVTAAGLTLIWVAGRVSISTYLVLTCLCAGPLLLTWPTRAHRYGRIQYALAVVVAAVCAIWAGSLYASSKGSEAAHAFVQSLPTDTAVTVWSAQRLDVAGPKVSEHDLGPGLYYRYEYRGLRLLTFRSGSYYLLPLGWTQKQGPTYVVTVSDQIRIDLYSAELNAS